MQSFKVRLRVREIKLPEWYCPGGGRMVNRWALDLRHPEHPYNWIKKHLGVHPEDFGVYQEGELIIGDEDWADYE